MSEIALELYPHQQELLDAVLQAFKIHRSVVMQLPTGGGKTIIAAQIAEKKYADEKKKVLVLVHREELLDQFKKTLTDDVGLDQEKLSFIAARHPDRPYKSWRKFQIGSIMTCVNRCVKGKIEFKPDFIIIDEAHHCRAPSWSKLLDKWPDAKILGLTATPIRLDGKGLGHHFDEIVQGKSMSWLIDNKCLCRYVYKVPVDNHLDMSGVHMQMGDYNQKETYKRVDKKVIADASKAYQTYAEGRSALFFGINCEHSKRVAQKLQQDGINAEHVDGETPQDERKDLFDRFKQGEIKVLCNVNIATEGLDIPGCDVVMLGRPTKSLTIYLQQIGRALRYQEEKPEKVALILDLVHHYANEEFGLPNIERKWSLKDMDPADFVNESRYTTVVCSNCRAVYSVRRRECPECGHVRQPPVPVEKEMKFWTVKSPLEKAARPKEAGEQYEREKGQHDRKAAAKRRKAKAKRSRRSRQEVVLRRTIDDQIKKGLERCNKRAVLRQLREFEQDGDIEGECELLEKLGGEKKEVEQWKSMRFKQWESEKC